MTLGRFFLGQLVTALVSIVLMAVLAAAIIQAATQATGLTVTTEKVTVYVVGNPP